MLSRTHALIALFFLKVVGDSTPRLSHRDEMHYTNAVLHESLRMTSLATYALFHTTLADVKVKDYVLPTGTIIFPSLVSVAFNPKYFPNPHAFKPERFLSEDGSFMHDEHLIPFGIGKRVCMGQTLAEKQLFLFFVGLMQKFDFAVPNGQRLPSYHVKDESTNGLFRSTPKFETVISRRF